MAKNPYARLLVAGATALALLVGAGGSGFAAEPETGTIAGRYTDDGVAAANTPVGVQSLDFATYRQAVTNEAGEYQVSDLPPGQYKVSFGSSDGGPGQYYHGKSSFFEADTVTVNAGEVTTADDEELPWGLARITVVDRAGAPVAGAQIEFAQADGGPGSSGPTDESGVFYLPLRVGRYKVRVTLNPFTQGSFTQWVPGVADREQAQIFELADGQSLNINETLMPTGKVSGRFTDAAGNGLADVFVLLNRPNAFPFGTARTGPDGSYTVQYVPTGGQFTVQFLDYARGISQYAYGTVHPEQATTFSVSDGQQLVVNDSLLPTGSVRVTAKDAATGAAISSFGVSLMSAGYGETSTGAAVIENVPIGTHPVLVSGIGFEEASGSVTVTAGQQASVEVTMRSKSKIEATVVDSATGQPVSGVCLVVATVQNFMLPDGCAGASDAQGRTVVETPGAGWYQVLAYPAEAEGYGAQWVGANGGSGSQLNAKLIKVEAGKGSQAPVIKLDRGGSVTGIIRDTAGAPVKWADAAIGPWSNEVGGGILVTTTDEDGRYTLDRLGPYQWPLLFQVRELREYSGGVANRHLAQTVSVHSGQTTNYDFQMRTPVAVTANVSLNADSDCYLYLLNAVTGDRLSSGWVESCRGGSVSMNLVGPQLIKVSVVYRVGDNYVQKWYGGGSFLTAKPIILPASGSKTVNLRF
ncbi:hypothetical protein Rhe02_94990 [Rhizocola hellebori]|uniref:Alpha-amylase n=1 Tax=Rhizocola hellebori TaxID=1392758 RepID=A0A8J3QJX5_9ACTN|nr:carboxypeptidase-like regulatory domain-containing protein [Rhizocola hellebori]GIH11432.1 hypothetical protein Rhe02_94990 [Rhizocola hellebori]